MSLSFAFTQEGFETWAEAIKLSPRRPSVILENGSPLADVTFSTDGKLFAVADMHRILLMDGASLQTISTLPQDNARVLAFSPPDGRFLAAGVGKKVVIWSIAERKLVREITPERADFSVMSIAFDADAKRLAIAGDNRYARIFETEGGSEILREWSQAVRAQSFQAGGQSIRRVTFSPDGRWLLTGGSRVAAWDLTAPIEPPSQSDAAPDRVRSVIVDDNVGANPFVAFSRDGCTRGDQRRWFVPPGSTVIFGLSKDSSGYIAPSVGRASRGDLIFSLADFANEARNRQNWPCARQPLLSPSGKWLVTADKQARTLGLTDGAAFKLLQHETAVIAIAVSPNGPTSP